MKIYNKNCDNACTDLKLIQKKRKSNAKTKKERKKETAPTNQIDLMVQRGYKISLITSIV
jgi:hypothetical protein